MTRLGLIGLRASPRRRAAAVVAGLLGAVVATGLAGAAVPLVLVSTDPYTNTSSQHQTEVESDTFAFGSTIVSTFQAGRFWGGGASNVGWATSTNGGATWTPGFLPGTTVYATPAGSFDRISDPTVAYDPKHGVWIISTLGIRNTGPWSVLTSRSTDGLNWSNPVVVSTGSGLDKNWTVCDTHAGSPFYGNCYTQWDVNSQGNLIKMSTSTDGGITWGPALSTADNGTGLGGQPLVRRNGTVVVPIGNANLTAIRYFTSTNGGASWGATQQISPITDHHVAGSLRALPLPSADVDRRGKVYVVWHDCRFRTGCSSNDIVLATINPRGRVSRVVRIPIDPVSSTVDHFIPGIAVDPTTSGRRARLALLYYYYPLSACGPSCELHVGFISSTDGGTTWSAPTDVAGPMSPTWLADTSQGRMVGDYTSASFVGANVWSVFAVAGPPNGPTFDEDMYAPAGGFAVNGGSTRAGVEQSVPNAASDHPAPTEPLTSN